MASDIDPNIRDLDGLTPADLAEECGHLDCANFLLKRESSELSASPNLVSSVGIIIDWQVPHCCIEWVVTYLTIGSIGEWCESWRYK